MYKSAIAKLIMDFLTYLSMFYVITVKPEIFVFPLFHEFCHSKFVKLMGH